MTVAACEALSRSLRWNHERVQILHDPDTGLEAVIAIHSTALGPALGGLRIRPYEGGLAEALDDALRLSRAMTLKASAAGLDLGGGKAVVVNREGAGPRARRLAALAGEIERLGGAYITAEDIGTTTADMDFIAEHTSYVVGRSERNGTGGDPSPDTARTVFGGIRAALAVLDGDTSLRGKTVGVIGLGKVGAHLTALLADAGARVVGYDPVPEARRRCRDRVDLVDAAAAVLGADLDVLAPCAVGGLVDAELAEVLRCRVVCGAANNPLSGPEAAEALARRGILYVPDFLANCGGLIHADAERLGDGNGERLERALAEAEARTLEVLVEAVETGVSPAALAEARAWERVERARNGAAAAAPRPIPEEVGR
ncbi:MAG TPA: Glu/Leu/Phe/Val dehydrogenase dimerization domain-containing protein [Solirubrobacterales bacterium]|nr:Glu/Leu/Phe/Val dehydrogenase dimerization domain-containing protein [Solirubrobacterales bacterium]